MSRPDRWWRPATRRRPPQRARQRQTFSSKDTAAFDSGYAAGYVDGLQRRSSWSLPDHEDPQPNPVTSDDDLEVLRRARDADPERFHEIAEAVREGGDALRRLAWRWGITSDDLMDVAEDAGVTPLPDVDPGRVVVEIEEWLRRRDAG